MDVEGCHVEGELHRGKRIEPRGAAETWAVIGCGEVVVDGLGDPDDADIVGETGNLEAGVHRVVSAVVEKHFHAMFFECFQDRGVVLVLHLVPATPERRARRPCQYLRILRAEVGQVHEVTGYHALDTPASAEDPLYPWIIPGRGDDTGK